MAESLEASADITLIRRELERLRKDVKEVDAKVEQTRVMQLAAMAISLGEKTGADPALIMVDAGMKREEVCMATGLSPAALRQRISRARSRAKPKKGGG